MSACEGGGSRAFLRCRVCFRHDSQIFKNVTGLRPLDCVFVCHLLETAVFSPDFLYNTGSLVTLDFLYNTGYLHHFQQLLICAGVIYFWDNLGVIRQ